MPPSLSVTTERKSFPRRIPTPVSWAILLTIVSASYGSTPPYSSASNSSSATVLTEKPESPSWKSGSAFAGKLRIISPEFSPFVGDCISVTRSFRRSASILCAWVRPWTRSAIRSAMTCTQFFSDFGVMDDTWSRNRWLVKKWVKNSELLPRAYWRSLSKLPFAFARFVTVARTRSMRAITFACAGVGFFSDPSVTAW